MRGSSSGLGELRRLPLPVPEERQAVHRSGVGAVIAKLPLGSDAACASEIEVVVAVAVDALRVAALACDPVVVGIGRRDLADVFGARASTDLGAGRRLSSDLRRSAARIGYGVFDVEPPCPVRVRAAPRATRSKG
jgi:hypothetical protein